LRSGSRPGRDLKFKNVPVVGWDRVCPKCAATSSRDGIYSLFDVVSGTLERRPWDFPRGSSRSWLQPTAGLCVASERGLRLRVSRYGGQANWGQGCYGRRRTSGGSRSPGQIRPDFARFIGLARAGAQRSSALQLHGRDWGQTGDRVGKASPIWLQFKAHGSFSYLTPWKEFAAQGPHKGKTIQAP
jgi:hypothetical protein